MRGVSHGHTYIIFCDRPIVQVGEIPFVTREEWDFFVLEDWARDFFEEPGTFVNCLSQQASLCSTVFARLLQGLWLGPKTDDLSFPWQAPTRSLFLQNLT